MKVNFESFLKLQFGLVTFWQKDIGKKSWSKMLVKLSVGIDFINNLRALFSPISFCQKIIKPKCNRERCEALSYEKGMHKMLMKSTSDVCRERR